MSAPWSVFAHTTQFAFSLDSLRAQWAQLHAGDAEPLPRDTAVLHAWALFHSGHFEQAAQAGLQAGGAGLVVAHKATCIYAVHLEPQEARRNALFSQVAERAAEQAQHEPDNANAWYWQACALGRYSQSISVSKALAQGLGGKIKSALERAIALAPHHADAHLALGAFHAEVIDKVGPLIGAMAYGASKEAGLNAFAQAHLLHPSSVIGKIESANGLLMLHGDTYLPQATALYEQAATAKPLDAMDWLDAQLARAELAD